MKKVRIEFSNRFEKSLKKTPRKIQIAFRNRLELFLTDKFHPLLNSHCLSGKYQEYRSINISGDWRVVYREFDEGKIVYFDFIGTHNQLYK